MNASPRLKRSVGLAGAVLLGLGSIVGTGVFVTLGLAAGTAGSAMPLALLLAGMIAICNGLSSAQLAAAHPVSGGTYEYGYRYLNPWLGYGAGWLFVCAKSASAATAAIGFGGYFAQLTGLSFLAAWQWGLIAVMVMTAIILFGIRRSNAANALIVGITLGALIVYVIVVGKSANVTNLVPRQFDLAGSGAANFFEAVALLFVAYTGYGRVATLGEEIVDPVRNIPRAVVITLGVSFLLYFAVSLVSLGAVGAERYGAATRELAAPLEFIAQHTGHPWVAKLLAIGAVTAMLGVLLNLLLGLSRVLFAMGVRGDLPRAVGRVDANGSPYVGVLICGAIIFALVLLQDIKLTWSFSAFTVLVYYALTNAAAIRLPADAKLYPRALAWIGLVSCLGLSIWVDQNALWLGVILLGIGFLWRLGYRRMLNR